MHKKTGENGSLTFHGKESKFEKRNQVVRSFCQKLIYKFHKVTEYLRHQEMITEILLNFA